MGYEKEYKEALERARNLHKDAIDMGDNLRAKQCEIIFPELKESEDERIRKELIDFFSDLPDTDTFRGIAPSKIIAWLEKQGEQKHYSQMEKCINCQFNYTGYCNGTCILREKKVEPKFKVGDWITDGNITIQIEAIKNDCYLYCGDCALYSIKTADKVYHLWTIQDAKDGDVLACENGWTCIFRCLNDNLFNSYCFMDNEGWFCEDGGQAHTLDKRICGEIHPATKEQRDLLFSKMKEADYEWDTEKKELKKIHNALEECEIENIEHGKYYYCIKDYFAGGKKQASKGDVVQALRGLPIMALGVKANEYFTSVNSIKGKKPAWSEEDEEMRIDAIKYLELFDAQGIHGDVAVSCIEWLKSLKERIKGE